MATKIFVNLPVKDIKRTRLFFSSLGYSFNEQFSNENGACLVIAEDIYVMLLVEKFYKTFITKPIADTTRSNEVIVALTLDSRKAVDELADKALNAGGREYRARSEEQGMYVCTFEDLDGHLWEIGYMDMSKMPGA